VLGGGDVVGRGPPNRANQRNLSEVTRLFSALAKVVPAHQIGGWLEAPNPAFEGSTPLQVIERGESDRLWRMVWESLCDAFHAKCGRAKTGSATSPFAPPRALEAVMTTSHFQCAPQ
jgi:hypothetical protein